MHVRFCEYYTIARGHISAHPSVNGEVNARFEGMVEDKVVVWYLLDEFGVKIQHSESPTCKCHL